MESQTFLTTVKSFLTATLEMGTSIYQWCVSTEGVCYFLAIAIIGGAIGLVHRVRRG